MATQIFDNELVRVHPIYPKAKSYLAQLSLRDYGKPYFDTRIECLDMDSYETSLPQNVSDSTMDGVIGIAEYDDNRNQNRRLLMIELRMNYRTPHHLKTSSLNKKVSHTIQLLSCGSCPLANYVLFIFDNGILQQAIRWMRDNQCYNNSGKSWLAMSPEMFNEIYLCESDLPYVPVHEFDSAKDKLLELLNSQSFDDIYEQLDWWGQEYYRWSYSTQESSLIREFVKNIWDEIILRKDAMDEETLDMFNLLAEEYPNFMLQPISL